MVELLKYEFYRLYKSKFAWVLTILMAALPILAVTALSLILAFISHTGDDIDFSSNDKKFILWLMISYFYKWVPMAMALFVPLFVGRDYRDGFIRNKLTAGHTRFQIFTSAIISKAAFAFILCVVYIIAGIVASLFTHWGVNLNGGEMLLRAFTLILSAISITVLYTVLALIIKNRAVPVILSVVFVMSFSIFGMVATSFAYDHDMIHDYAKLRSKRLEQIGYDLDDDDFDEDKYFHVGWYLGHPISVLTNAALQEEFVPVSGTMSLSMNGGLSYSDTISRHPFNSLISVMTNGVSFIEEDDYKKIDGAIISIETAELQYNIKSVVWMAVYFGGGYALFRKKNVF